MNVAVKTWNQFALPRVYGDVFVSRTQILFVTLFLLVLISAFSVIYVKDVNRRLQGQLQTLDNTYENLHAEWSQLLLEESTLTSAARVESLAQTQLQMVMPKTKSVIVI